MFEESIKKKKKSIKEIYEVSRVNFVCLGFFPGHRGRSKENIFPLLFFFFSYEL